MSNFPRFPGTKDPDNSVLLSFRGSVQAGDPAVSATVTEVDSSDAAVASPGLTLSAPQIDVSAGYTYATCSCSGGAPGQLYLLRSRWTLASGRTCDRTVRLYVAHN